MPEIEEQYSRTNKREMSMEREIAEIKEMVKSVKEALSGGPITLDGGLVQQLRDLKAELILFKKESREREIEQEKRITDLEDFKKKAMIYIGVGMAISAFIGYAITMILNMFHPSPIIMK